MNVGALVSAGAHLMFWLVGTIILTSLNMGVWTFIGAVIRFYGWFGDARGVYIIFIGAMGFAAAQLIVGILGIVNNGKGRKLRCPRCCSVIALGSSNASSTGLGVVVGLAQGLEVLPVPLASAFGQGDHVVDLLGRCAHPDL